jgi:hypothetical protein
MNRRGILFISILFIIIGLSTTCKNEEPSNTPVKFSGIVFKDEYGNDLGIYGGSDDNDWQFDETWTEETWGIMDFEDTIDLSGTYLNQTYFAPENIQFTFFPNPVANYAIPHIIMPGRLKVKIAMVAKNLNTVFHISYKDQDTSMFNLDLSDTVKFIEGDVYRVYYTFSVEGMEDFYKGHGDVLMCYQRPANLLCLDYLDEK